MKKNTFKISITTLIFSLFNFVSCKNPGYNGPDVITQHEVEKKINEIYNLKMLQLNNTDVYTSNYFLNYYITNEKKPSAQTILFGCNKNRYYYTNSVEYCLEQLWLINSNNRDNLDYQFYLVRNLICDLKFAKFDNMDEPFQGELDICQLIK